MYSTGHILPGYGANVPHVLSGYGAPVSKLRRARSAGYPLDKQTLLEIAQRTHLERQQFDAIRSNARSLWSYPEDNETSYDNHFKERPADELQELRPSSPTRRNRPHPPPVFLTNRLHYVPGYHNADATVGKGVYQVDASVPPEQQEERRAARRKYLAQRDPALVNNYKDPFGLRQVLDGRSAQGAEAWLKLADEADRGNVMHVVQKDKEVLQELERSGKSARGGGQNAVASAHRWMRYAGAAEADAVGRIANSLETDPDNIPYHAPPDQTFSAMRARDIAATANVRRLPRLSRGDYSIHPDWNRFYLAHHKVPGC